MDDFGTGYSSLSYLSRFPVDILKMDRSFLRDGATPQTSVLASAVIALGETLQLEVVAEGIEYSDAVARAARARLRLGPGLPVRRTDGRRRHARVPAQPRGRAAGAHRSRCTITTKGSTAAVASAAFASSHRCA